MSESCYPREIQFTLAGSPLRGLANPLDNIHTNVLCVSLIRSAFASCVAKLFSLFPFSTRRWLGGLLPARFHLSSTIVLKTLKPGWEEEFANERDMYTLLSPLQGTAIPHFLGDAELNRQPSIALSYIDGVPTYDQGDTPLAVDEFESQIDAILWSFTRFGVVYDDSKLDNFLVRKGRVVVVDLESVGEVGADKYELAVTSHREHIMLLYRNYLKSLADPW